MNYKKTSLLQQAVSKNCKEVFQEDWSRNLLVFRGDEEAEEDLKNRMTSVVKELSEKPRIKAAQIGRGFAGKTWPIKVLPRNSGTVHQILVITRISDGTGQTDIAGRRPRVSATQTQMTHCWLNNNT